MRYLWRKNFSCHPNNIYMYKLWQPGTVSEPPPPKQDTITRGKTKKACFIPNSNIESLAEETQKNVKTWKESTVPSFVGGIPVTHEDRSLRTGATWLGEPWMGGEAGYLSPASAPGPQVLCMSLARAGLHNVYTVVSGTGDVLKGLLCSLSV